LLTALRYVILTKYNNQRSIVFLKKIKTKIKTKMKKIVSLITVMILIAGALSVVPSANAVISGGAVTGATAVDLVAGTVNADYNVSFDTSITAIATTITVTFPINYTITDGALGATAVQSCIPAGSNICVTGANVAVTGVVGDAVNRTITITIPATDLSAGVGVSFRILTGITNPTTSGTTGTFTLMSNAAGEAAQTNVAGVNITPAAIINLACEPSGQAGAVWLRWTTPAGTSAGYGVQYEQGNTITGSAITFAQSWTSGTVGTIQQQLLTGLNPNTQYTFAMTARGGGGTISAVSSLTPICFAPASARPNPDAAPPTSRITSPVTNSNVLAGQPLTIRGTAIDTGGSSVQRVEVSLDGGATWNLARIVDNVQGNLVWELVWRNPVVGAQTIRTRAYDWVGNIETAGDGIAVNVVTTLPVVAETPVVAVPDLALPHLAPTTVVQMQENLAVLQTKLISLLQQLLTVLTAQLQALR